MIPFLALRLLGLKSALGRALGVVGRYPWQTAVIALAVACGLLWHANGVEHRRAETERKGRALDRATYIAAEAEAAAIQLAANNAVSARYTNAAKESDHAYELALDRAHAGAAGYARDHSVRLACASGASRGGVAPAVFEPAPSGDGTGGDGIVVTRADFDSLSRNTAQLQQVNAWADGLIAAGLAVPAD